MERQTKKKQRRMSRTSQSTPALQETGLYIITSVEPELRRLHQPDCVLQTKKNQKFEMKLQNVSGCQNPRRQRKWVLVLCSCMLFFLSWYTFYLIVSLSVCDRKHPYCDSSMPHRPVKKRKEKKIL